MSLFWTGILLLVSVPLLLTLALVLLLRHLCVKYLAIIPRIFQEKPLFVVPRGQPLPLAEVVQFPSGDGLTLRGCYLKADQPRRGVILFGLEFGSDIWSCWGYVSHLIEAGFDVFAFEPRNQGESDTMPGYEPLQWLTEYEVNDTRAAIRYLRSRPDADPQGIGFFGVSKGGNAGLYVACEDPYVRCCVTDGAFGTYQVVVPYMRQWFRIYNQRYVLQRLLPMWYYGILARLGLELTEKERGCRYRILEHRIHRLAPRPLMMIHGECDNYIRPEMAQALFDRARSPREFWLVPNAKHNHALHLAGEEYRSRVLAFFETHLATGSALSVQSDSGVNGHGESATRIRAQGVAVPGTKNLAANPSANSPSAGSV